MASAAACGGGKPAPAEPVLGTSAGTATEGDDGLAPEPDADDGAPLEERIAAIEHAMNELAPVASQCWAAAAADDLNVAGAVRMLVTVGRDGSAKAEASHDEPGDPVLIRCLADVLAAYPWAPPVRGQTVELPFAFRAPAMQNVLDRRMVPRKAQAGVEVAALLHQANTANGAVSLLEVTMDAGTTRAPRGLERTELWMFRSPARVGWAGAKGAISAITVDAGDAVWAPAGALLQVEPAPSAPGGLPPTRLEAVVAIIPGGLEGTARAGALPGASVPSPPPGRTYPQPVRVVGAAGKRLARPGGAVTLLVEPGVPDRAIGREASLLTFELEAGATVPPHTHAGETEVVYVLGGAGTMTVAGVSVPVTEHSVIQVPPGVEHSFTASEATSALQLYSPAGPEQRFKPAPPAPVKKTR